MIQLIPVLASVVVAVSTLMALVWGVWTYKRNADAQVQLLALQTLQRYLDLAVAHPELASRADGQPVDARYAWFAAHALTTAETLWSIVRHQANWRRSIDAIVRHHRSYLQSDAFVSADFDPAFVGYVRDTAADLERAGAGDQRPLRRHG